MKICYLSFVLLLWIFTGFAQDYQFEVYGTQTNPANRFLLTLDSIEKVKCLGDIIPLYPADWVANYYGVEVAATCGSQVQNARGANDQLTAAQLDIIRNAKANCKIAVEVDYLPKNNLKDNPPRKMQYALTIIPIYEAFYLDGPEELASYLEQKIIEQIPAGLQEEIALAKFRFTINEAGLVTEARMIDSSNQEIVDQLIMETLCNMPGWSPARDYLGRLIPQEFEFVLGTKIQLGGC